MIKEVYGPRDNGPVDIKDITEKRVHEIMKTDPLSEYLTGVLIPKSITTNDKNGTKISDPESETTNDDLGMNSEDDNDNEEIELSIPSELDPRLRSKSFGISFMISSKDPVINVCTTWARYFPQKIGVKSGNDNNNIWDRKPYYDIRAIDLLNDDLSEPINIFNEKNEGSLLLYVDRVDYENDNYFVSVILVNDLIQPSDESQVNVSSCVFQPSIRIVLNEVSEIPNFDQQSEEEDELHFIYRNRPIKAAGHMCSVVWKEIDYMDNLGIDTLWPDGKYFLKEHPEFERFINPDVRSEFVPLYPMPISSFTSMNDVNSNKLYAKDLSESWSNEDFDKFLSPLINKYEEWIKERVNEKTELDDKYNEIAGSLINKEQNALKRMKLGLEIIQSDENAKLAFCFANKAIDTQSKWIRGENTKFEWRPFQLAFFLMNIESIVNENSPDRNTLDLLWISTGGGKTEAYLGIMAFTIALRRLNNVNIHETGAGTSIISRYTLRLLTVQQFRRTLTLLTAAEYLRIKEINEKVHGWRPKSSNIEGDWIYGSTRFSAGMWVGKAVTPLNIRGDDGAIGILENVGNDGESSSDAGDPAQIVRCPVCNHWISIPNGGLPKEDKNLHKLHVIVKINNDNIQPAIEDLNCLEFVENTYTSNKNLKDGYITFNFDFIDEDISIFQLKELKDCLTNFSEIASLNFYRPGYFGTLKKPQKGFSDYEIFCTNPECEINDINWKEGIPAEGSQEYMFPDGNYERSIPNLPFKSSTRMPIPAYTVDEQVYFKCPTVVISTADKIARLAFEPRAAGLFGNVEYFNSYYGYHRVGNDDVLPKYPSKRQLGNSIKVKPLKSPDLIIQDELHLIDGPLGSLFGLYESVVSGILSKKGGNPKYIASTATINNSEEQTNLIFSKKLFQFPPYGLSIDDNFFVKEHIENKNTDPNVSVWNEENRGQIYMGIYSAGRGPMTPQIRLWSRIFETCNQNKDDDNILYYWTLVGYYNSMRELGGGGALYREDIKERLSNIGSTRKLNPNIVELSSRIPSTDIPLILNEIEMDGNRPKNKTPQNDAILTTSMFGTGVDVGHLSTMIVTGQPKTTGSYIQATGRIGREHGGLVLAFLRAGKPRDLNHYETFPSYHYRLHLGIEPVSVSPFSVGALNKALGSGLVSFLRNSLDMKVDWTSREDATAILNEDSNKDFEYFEEFLRKRLNNIYPDDEDLVESIISYLQSQFDRWKQIAKDTRDLTFQEYGFGNKKLEKNVVLGDPAHEHNEDLKIIYKNVPQSLREIEETTGFWV